MTFEMPECVDLCRSIVVATHSPGGFGGRAAALEVNHVTGFPEVFFPLRSLFFPLVKPTFRESAGKDGKGVVCVSFFNDFLLFLLGPLLQIQGQHCHLCPRGALQKRKRQNRQLLKALRKSTVATP